MVTPYLVFSGRCREALELYKAAFGSEIKMSQLYGDYVPEGMQNPPANLKEWVLHAEMDICETTFWFADEVFEPVIKGTNVKLTVQVPDAAAAQSIYDALYKDAHITLPPTKTFYSTFHAGLVDIFGVSWNITALEAPAQAYEGDYGNEA